MAFDDVQLPTDIEKGAVGGPTFKTAIVTLASGAEARNQEWARQRHTYDISYGVDNKTAYDALLAFFYERRGAARGFRFKDWRDYDSNGLQTIGVGTGSLTTFQLTKTYGSTNAYARKITRVVSGTLVVKVAGVTTVAFTQNLGLITFTTPPGAGASVQASFQFDVPVRFENDDLMQTLENENVITIPAIKLLEILE